MKSSKKLIYIIITILALSLCFTLGYIYSQSKIDKTHITDEELPEKIMEILSEEVEIYQKYEDEIIKEEPDSTDSIISDALKESIISNQSTDNKPNNDKNNSEIHTPNEETVTVIDGNTVMITVNGKEQEMRLIGLKPGANASGLQELIDKASKLHIEYDVVKTKNGVFQGYLWAEEVNDKERNNMINIQMILNGYATTTYMNQSDGMVEVPNAKYSTTFIQAQKNVDRN